MYANACCADDWSAHGTKWNVARHPVVWLALAPVREPPYVENLEPNYCILPQRLGHSGYVTGMAGKWHLTNNQHGDYANLKASADDAFGFDYVAPPGLGSQNEGDKWVDDLTDFACPFMRDHRDRPWFFYLAHHKLHSIVAVHNSDQKLDMPVSILILAKAISIIFATLRFDGFRLAK